MKQSLALLLAAFLLLCAVPAVHADLSSLNTSLWAYYSFDNGTLTDAVGGHTLTAGGTTVGVGKVNDSRQTNTNNDNLAYSGSEVRNQSFAINLWVWRNSTGGQQAIFNSGTGFPRLNMWAFANGTIGCSFGNTSTSTPFVSVAGTPDQTWFMATCVSDQAQKRALLYLNGALSANLSYTNAATQSAVYTFFRREDGFDFKGKLDEIAIYNRTISTDEVVSLYNNSYALPFPFGNGSGPAPPAAVVLNFTARNIVDNGIVQYYCVNITNGTNSSYGCANNTQDFGGGAWYPTADTGVTLYNITGNINVTYAPMYKQQPPFGGLRSYFNQTRILLNVNSSQNISVNTSQGLANISAFRLFLNTSINTFNVTNNQTRNTTTGGTTLLPLNVGANNIQIDVPGNYSLNGSCTAGASPAIYDCNLTGIYDNRYAFNASDLILGTSIQNFSLVVSNGSLGGVLYSESTTNGSLNLSLLQGYTYAVQFTTTGGVYEYVNVSLPANASYHRYNFNVFPTPSISITIRDVDTGDLILENVSIQLIGNVTAQTNYTATGGFFSNRILNGTYSVKIGNANYTETTYTQELTLGSVTYLTAFLSRATDTVIFTFVDSFSSSTVLPNVAVSQSQVVNGSWQVISSRITDITGRTSFTYDPGTAYRFSANRSDYLSKTFDLDPILFDAYTIKMTRNTTLNASEDYQSIYIGYTPQVFYDAQQNQINLSFLAPLNTLQRYNYTIRYPGGSKTGGGTNSGGQNFTVDFNITGANASDRVNISITYQSTIGNLKSFNFSNAIIVSPGANTFIKNRDNTYGLGIFERALVGVLIIIVFAGLVALAAGPLPALTMGLLLMGLFIKIGFWEWWLAGISFLVGFAVLAARSS